MQLVISLLTATAVKRHRREGLLPHPCRSGLYPVLDFRAAAAVPLARSLLRDNWCVVTQTISRLIENWGFGNSFNCGWGAIRPSPFVSRRGV